MSDNIVDLPVAGKPVAGADTSYELAATDTKARRVKRRLTSRTATVVALVIAVVWTIPTFGLFISSFRPEEEIKTTGWWTIFQNPGFTLANYQEVLFASSPSAPQLGQYFVNSLAITIPATIFPLVLATLAAYAFAWMNFKGSGAPLRADLRAAGRPTADGADPAAPDVLGICSRSRRHFTPGYR